MLEVKIKKRLDEFNLEVDFLSDEKLIAIRGPSGAGKTTLLRCISGIETPEVGYIKIGSQVILDTNKKFQIPTSKRGVGFAFQDYLLFPHLNAYENILYGKNRKGLHQEHFTRILSSLSLSDSLLQRYPLQLSGGEKQRVSLARALANGKKLLLLDEPFNALEQKMRYPLMDLIKWWVDKFSLTALIVAHDEKDINYLTSRYICMIKGGLVSPNAYENQQELQSNLVGWHLG